MSNFRKVAWSHVISYNWFANLNKLFYIAFTWNISYPSFIYLWSIICRSGCGKPYCGCSLINWNGSRSTLQWTIRGRIESTPLGGGFGNQSIYVVTYWYITNDVYHSRTTCNVIHVYYIALCLCNVPRVFSVSETFCKYAVTLRVHPLLCFIFT